MKSHDELMALHGVVDPITGQLWALPRDGGPLQPITEANRFDPEYRNLINSSLFLYHIATEVEQGLSHITDWLETVGGDMAVPHVLKLSAALHLARRCAIEGIEKVASPEK